jgi:hypothetical protein
LEKRSEMISILTASESDIPVFPQPVRLGFEVTVDDVAFSLLETPGNNNNSVAFPDPSAFFIFPLILTHERYTVKAADRNMVCPMHGLCNGKLFVIPFFG